MAGFGSSSWGTTAWGASGVAPIEQVAATGMSVATGTTAEWYRLIADGLGLAASASSQPGIGVSDGVQLSAAVQASGLLLQLVTDNPAFEATVLRAWELTASDAVQAADSATAIATLLQVAADRLQLEGSAASSLHALAAVIAGAVLADQAGPGYEIHAADAAAFGDAAIALGTLLATAADAFGLSASAAGGVRVVVALDDALALDPLAATQLTALQAIEDGLRVGLTLRWGDEEYFAWVLHTEPVDRAGTRPVTEYRNFPFNSFASFDGIELGAGPGGIFELTGDDDAGTPIAAWIRSGMSNFGTNAQKRLPELFLAIRKGDEDSLFLKAVTVDPRSGEKTEDWFALEPRPGSATRETRGKIAQGLKSVFWGYALHNVDGADFALADVRLYPLVLEGKL